MPDRFSWDLLHCDRTKSDSTHPPNLTEGLRATRQSRPCTSFPRCHHLNWKWWNDLAKPHLESQTKANLQDHYPKCSANGEQTWFMLQATGAEIKCENVTGLTSFPSRDTGRVRFLSLSLQILFNARFLESRWKCFHRGMVQVLLNQMLRAEVMNMDFDHWTIALLTLLLSLLRLQKVITSNNWICPPL